MYMPTHTSALVLSSQCTHSLQTFPFLEYNCNLIVSNKQVYESKIYFLLYVTWKKQSHCDTYSDKETKDDCALLLFFPRKFSWEHTAQLMLTFIYTMKQPTELMQFPRFWKNNKLIICISQTPEKFYEGKNIHFQLYLLNGYSSYLFY